MPRPLLATRIYCGQAAQAVRLFAKPLHRALQCFDHKVYAFAQDEQTVARRVIANVNTLLQILEEDLGLECDRKGPGRPCGGRLSGSWKKDLIDAMTSTEACRRPSKNLNPSSITVCLIIGLCLLAFLTLLRARVLWHLGVASLP